MHLDALVAGGEVVQAVKLGERLVQQWAELPEDSRIIAAATTSIAAVAQGDLSSARDALATALEIESHSRASGGLPYLGIGYWLRIAFAEALARSGDVEAAVGALHEMQRKLHPAFVFLEPNRLLTAAWVSASRGHTSEALDLVSEATEFARSHGQYAREVMCIQTAIQFGANENHTDRLYELAQLVEGPRAELAARWSSAKAARDGDALLAVSADLEAMGDRVAAADAAAHAASVFHGQNLRGSKLTASGRAAQLVKACGATTPATRDTEAPLPLSTREREIATLVRDGLSNREIADKLTMSVRTVEGHIYRACNKLGLANRGELAELIKQSS